VLIERWTAALALVTLLVGCSDGGADRPASTLDSGVAATAAGSVRGLVAPDHVLFQGIPYAAAAVGELRFAPPAPPPHWEGMRDATKVGPRCIQDAARDPDWGRGMSEDCLSLNVWSPTDAEDLPVMVWIHGGAFVNGSADLYNAQWLATRGDIVVVTVNYRLGALGFLAHPALGPEAEVGNYGLADQQAALRWVRDNIAAFGGDPAKVTVAGESAGAMSVCDHLVSPGSAELFRAAILMSGPCGAQINVAAARQPSLDYAAGVGCPESAAAPACLRALPADALTEPVPFGLLGDEALSGPVTGTTILPVDPVEAMEQGGVGQLPVLVGTTSDEFTLFMALEFLRLGREPGPADYPGLLERTFGADAVAVERQYPLAAHADNTSLAYAAAVTDGQFACVNASMADGMAAAGAPVYSYEFTDASAPAPEPLRQVPFPVGASHSLELRYLFDIGGAPALNTAQQRLSDQMIGYFTAFVRDGVPAAPDAPEWPRLDGAGGPRMSFDTGGSEVRSGFEQEHQCDFWAGLRR